MKRPHLLTLPIILIAATLLAALLAAALLASEPLLNTTYIRTQVQDALQRATAHQTLLAGKLRLAWSLTPAITVNDVTLLNPPGLSRPAFATIRRIEARAALLPALFGRIDIPEITIEGADIRLERDAQGRGNWLPPPAAPAPATAPATPHPRTPPTIGRITLTDSRLAWHDAPPLDIARLILAPTGGPIEGQLTFRGVPFTIAGRSGPLDQSPASLDLTAVGGGLALSLQGEAGNTLALQLLIPDLAALQQLAARPLPAIKSIQLTAQLTPTGPTALHLTAGPSDLAPNLRLTRLDAQLSPTGPAAPDQPLTITAETTYQTLPIALSLNLGAPLSLLAPNRFATGRQPFQALALTDGASLALQGTLDPAASAPMPNIEATLSASIPDLRRTAALAGLALPPIRDATLTARILPASAGNGLLARGLRLSSAQGDISGDLAIGTTPRPSLRGSLQSQRLDLDAILTPAPTAPPPATPATSPPATPQPTTSLVPPTPLPFATLRLADADLRLAAAQITWHGAPYRAAEARLLLQDGRLRIDPIQAQAPGGPVQAPLFAQITADATATPPAASLTLRATGLDAAALAGETLSGALDLDIQLATTGADLPAALAAAQGHIGAALVDGEVENQALTAIFGPVLRAANLPAEAQGRSRLRCLALRIDPAGGIARIPALALDATRLRLEGDGTVNLIDETLDLHLRPTIRIGPTNVAIPVRLTGPLRTPKPELERGAISPGRFGLSIGGAAPDPCPPALTAARDGHAGRMPETTR